MGKVCLLSPSGVAGGAERALAELARHLPSFGWQPEAVLLQPGPLEGWLGEAGCPVEVLEASRTRYLHRTALTIRVLAQRFREQDADVVISNQSKGHLYGGLAGRPELFWQHGIPAPSALERVAGIVPTAAVVASSRDAVAAQRRLTPRARVELVPPGVEVDEIAGRRGSGAEIRRRQGLEGCPTVGIIGRLQPWKGQELFLAAAAQVAIACPQARFLVVGGALLGWEGSYPAELEGMARDRPELRGRVQFVGHQDDVYPWFDACDVVVNASRNEPFGLVVVEAMALGRPVVATTGGGPAEIIEDGVSGLLVPPEDPEAMSVAIVRILQDPGLADRLSQGARRRAAAFSGLRMAERWSDLLRTVARRSVVDDAAPSGSAHPGEGQ